jgi:acyl-CoA thioester hydrolase
MPSNPLEPAPLVSPTQTVIEDWIDYNGHLNMAFYNVIFDRAVDHFYDLLGVGAKYAEAEPVRALPWRFMCTISTKYR